MAVGRSDKPRSLFSDNGRGLEIGPSHNPLVPMAHGFNIEILGYFDAKALREKYSKAGLDVSAVE